VQLIAYRKDGDFQSDEKSEWKKIKCSAQETENIRRYVKPINIRGIKEFSIKSGQRKTPERIDGKS